MAVTEVSDPAINSAAYVLNTWGTEVKSVLASLCMPVICK
jgi:hypothetical protein